MIDLYTWTTPNGRKVSIALEEMGLDYETHSINIGQDEQFAPEFLKISPNNKIPAIVDRDNGRSLMESGAILLYLADKTRKIKPSGDGYWKAMEWLMWQMGGFGPMLGQVHHFVKYNKGKAPYAEERYTKEGKRLYGVLDRRLAEVEYVAGEYSIADMAIWPWYGQVVRNVVYEAAEFLEAHTYTNVVRWAEEIAKRPAVERGRKVNKLNGPLEDQLHERHDASDFDTKTQDKIEAAK